ncbi:ESPR-type extended signal peptide-containing protein [Acinetobacter larvae]|uniref:Autotransporter adhesin n=1 Tax=Acinetobacter larvae TaxID=1789224 RepID=A0A1B2M080_9GAMM|nr:ESPR-type extended signal peptide-containing protein [Acinetobacter larvae]AOA58602.1 hypothetical protein BFG52_09720 [Acinetobacter larvae]
MNKIYRVVWNASLNIWIAVSELASAKGKSSTRSQLIQTVSHDDQQSHMVFKKSKLIVSILGMTLFGTQFSFAADVKATEIDDCIYFSQLSSDSALALGCEAKTFSDISAAKTKSVALDGTDSSNITDLAISNFASDELHFFSVKGGSSDGNFNNDGAAGASSIAIGKNASVDAGSASGVAIGNQATVINQNNTGSADGIAIGKKATVIGLNGNGIALGSDATSGVEAAQGNPIAIGTRAKANQGASGLGSPVAIGTAAEAVGAGSPIAIGDWAKATGRSAISIGGNPSATANSALGDYSIVMGVSSIVEKDSSGSLALGRKAQILGTSSNSLALGTNTTVSAASGIAIGNGATVTQTGAITSSNSLALGTNTTVSAASGIAIGNGATVTQTGAIALGGGATTITNATEETQAVVGKITYSGFKGKVASSGMQLSIGSAGNERQLKNLATGKISTDSTDAINGSQLYATNQIIDNLADSVATILGGSSSVGTDGKITAPSYKIGETTVHTVGDAISNIDGRVTGNTTSITNIAKTLDQGAFSVSANGEGAEKVKKDATIDYANTDGNIDISNTGTKFQFNLADQLTVNNGIKVGANGPSLSKNGVDAANKVIANVSVGTISSSSKEAVNGSQLYATGKSVADALGGGATIGADGKVTAPSYTVDGKPVNNIGDAISNVDGRVTDNTTNITNIAKTLDEGAFSVSANGKENAVKVEKDAIINYANTDGNIDISNSGTEFQFNLADQLTVKDGIKVGTDGPSLGKDGIDAANKAITNIGTGAVEAGSKDAVTGDQLFTSNERIKDLDEKIQASGLIGDDGKAIAAVTYGDDDNVVLKGKDGSVISNLGAGKITDQSTDAVNGSQLYATGKSVADALGGGATIGADGKVTAPSYTVDGKPVNNIGDAISNVDGRVTDNTTNITNIAKTLDEGAFSVSANGKENAVKVEKDAIINYANTDGNIDISNSGTEFQFNLADQLTVKDGIKVGTDGPSLGKDGIDAANKAITNIGTGAVEAGSKDAVTGDQLFTSNERIKDLDEKIQASGLIGDDGKAIAAVTYGDDDNVVLKGKDGSVISNLGAGKITDQSTDAVNGSQLYATGKSVADALGGGATIGADGKVTAPSYTVDGKPVNNIGDAISNVDGRVTDNTTNITNIAKTLDEGAFSVSANGKENAVKVEKDAIINYANTDGNIDISNSGTEFQFNLADQLTVKDGIKVGTDGPSLGKDGIDAANKAITNIGTGAVEAGSKDAVTGDQLFTSNERIKDLDEKIQASGLIGDDGKAIAAVTYGDDDNVVLKGKDGSVISNLGAGKITDQSTDAVNGSQLYATGKSVADALGGGATIGADGKVTAPSYTVDGKPVNNIGDAISNVDGRVTDNTTNITNIAKTLDEGAFSVSANGKENAVKVEKDAIINYANTDGNIDISNTGTEFQFNLADQLIVQDGIKVGTDGPSLGKDGIDAANKAITNIGTGAVEAGSKDAVTGDQLFTSNERIKDLDEKIQASGLIGDDGKAIAAVTYGDDDNVVLKGKDGSVISNLGAGKITDQSTDAVNGSQLYATGKSVADALGGGATIGADGKVTAPSYTVDGKPVNNIGDAISNVDDRVTNITETLDEGAFSVSANGKENAVKVEKDAIINYANTDGNIDISNTGTEFQFNLADQLIVQDGIKVGTDGPSLGKDGIDAANKAITNIGTGAVEAGSKDAVTGDQLFTSNERIKDLDEKIQASGLIGDDGKAIAAVTYDDAGDVALKGKDGKASRISNVDGGSIAVNSSEAINGAQLYYTNKTVADALGGGATVDAEGKVTAPSYKVDGKTVNNLGDAISNVDDRVTNITETLDEGAFSVSANGKENAVKVEKDAIINYANTDGNIDISNTGTEFQFNLADQLIVQDGIKVGTDGPSLGKDGIDAAGTVISNIKDGINAGDAVSKGQLDKSLKDIGILNGDNKLLNVVTYDESGKVSLNDNAGQGSILTNIANGKIEKDSRDAINGTQLYNTNKSVAEALGGGSTVDADGKVTAPSYTVGDKTVNNLGDAISNVDDRVTNITETLDEGAFSVSANGKENAVKVEKDAIINYANTDGNIDISNTGTEFQFNLADQLTVKDGIKIGASGPSITKDGIDAAGTVISNIKDGINAGDAVSKGQLDKSLKDIGILNGDNKLLNVVTYDESGKVSLNDNAGQGSILTNIANGKIEKDSRDAINGTQLYNTNKSVAEALGGGSTVDANGKVTAPSYTVGDKTVNNLGDAISNVDNRVTNITETLDEGAFSVSANGTGAVKVEKDATIDYTNKDGNIKITQSGTDFQFNLADQLTVKDGIKIGASGPSITKDGIDAAGTVISNIKDGINAGDAVSKGQLDKSLKDIGILGEDGKLLNAVTYDESGKVSLNDNAGQGSTLTNVANGKIAKDSRDAINGGQLFTSNENLAKALGGGAMLDNNGNLIGPNYQIGGQVFTNIGGALSNIDGRVSTIQGQVNNIVAKSESTVSYAVDENGELDKDKLVLAGNTANIAKDSKGNSVVTSGGTTIENVANGVTASDAVNKGQLDKTLSDAKDYTDQRINDVTNGMSEDISNVKTDVNNIQEGKDGMFQVNTQASVVKPQASAENTLAGGSGAEASAENAVALGNNAVAKGKNSVALGQGSVADRENTVSVGSEDKERQITHVAAGTKETDAVNVSQLNDVKSTLAETQEAFTQQINDTNRYVYNVDKRSRAGIAGVSAMANIPQVMVGGQKSLGVGVGSYRGQNAIAVGGSFSSDDGKWVFKGSAAFDSQEKSTVGAGVSRVW